MLWWQQWCLRSWISVRFPEGDGEASGGCFHGFVCLGWIMLLSQLRGGCVVCFSLRHLVFGLKAVVLSWVTWLHFFVSLRGVWP